MNSPSSPSLPCLLCFIAFSSSYPPLPPPAFFLIPWNISDITSPEFTIHLFTEWSAWGAWGACEGTCGTGTQTRTRTCTAGTCTESTTEDQSCTDLPDCPGTVIYIVPSSENFLIAIPIQYNKRNPNYFVNEHEKSTKISYPIYCPILSIRVSTENFLRILKIQYWFLIKKVSNKKACIS